MPLAATLPPLDTSPPTDKVKGITSPVTWLKWPHTQINGHLPSATAANLPQKITATTANKYCGKLSE